MYLCNYGLITIVVVLRNGWPSLPMFAAADKYRPASLAPGWKTTRVFGEEFLPHIKTRFLTSPTLPHTQWLMLQEFKKKKKKYTIKYLIVIFFVYN